ncbi:triose-phosphate isomerase, partial [Mycoplasmopsis bovis]
MSWFSNYSIKYDITPIICIGESKEDRDAGRTEEAIH